MSLQSLFGSVRKVGNLLVVVFPGLGHGIGRCLGLLRFLVTNPLVRPLLDRLTASRRGAAFLDAARHFWWGTYEKERADWSQLPSDAPAMLRPVFAASIALCLLLPVAVLHPGATVAVQEVSGGSGQAPIWSILLWMAGVAVGWSCLLAGTGRSNWPAFLLVEALFLYNSGYVAFARLPRSYWNLLLPAAAWLAAVLAARARPASTRGSGRAWPRRAAGRRWVALRFMAAFC